MNRRNGSQKYDKVDDVEVDKMGIDKMVRKKNMNL